MTSKITIIDYGLGNLLSISNMLNYLNIKYEISSNPRQIADSQKLIIPGVGSFDNAINLLQKNKIYDSIIKAFESDVIILGICLGMQILCKGSEEGNEDGLNFFNTVCKKFNKNNNQFTTMGWMKIKTQIDDPIVNGIDKNSRFYFLHSYYIEASMDFTISNANNFQTDYSCIIKNKNIYGFQFHPERSHNYGLKILENFSKV